MEKFEEIKYNFKNTRYYFCENVRDKVGASIDSEQLEQYEQTLNIMINIEQKVEVEMLNIDRLLIEARAILPKVVQ